MTTSGSTDPAPVSADVPTAAPAAAPAVHAAAGQRRPLALSPSRASDFKQCPLLYRFRAIDRLPEAPSVAQARGNLVHAALESLFGLPADERSPAGAVGLVAPSWDRLRAQRPELDDLVPERDRAGFLDGARRLIDTYFEMEDPRRFEPRACELRVEARLEDGTRLRGFMDRVDVAPTGQVRIVDYKTGRVPRGPGEAAARFQMKFYALALLRSEGTVPAQLKLMYLKEGAEITYEPRTEELERFARTLSAIWQAIVTAGANGDFRPSPSKLCDWCDHKPLCPAFGGTPPPYPGWPEAI